jgi:uncharacterized protein YhbP (UPF0306 family)
MDLNKLAREIVKLNQYLTLCTYSGSGSWASPVAYAYDEDYSFYFISLPNSKHIQNIEKNSKVTATIFDSHQVFGEGVGLQIEAHCSQVLSVHLPEVVAIYLRRDWPFINNKIQSYLLGFQKILKNRTYRAYQIEPERIWMNDPNSAVDVRVEVNLN